MVGAQGAGTGRDERDLSVLAGRLAEIARRLAETLPNIAEEGTRDTLLESLATVRSACASVRAIDAVFDPAHARQFARHGASLKRLAADTGEVVADLAAANQHVAERLDTHIQELEDLAQESMSDEVGDRLKSTVARARQMASEMYETFGAIAGKVSAAARGIAALEKELSDARDKAFVDALTRVHSRAALDERLDAGIREVEARGPWALVLLDVDGFQQVIEQHGPIVGDAMLFKIARVIEQAVAPREDRCFLARYGGEQFALLVVPADVAGACEVAEEVRAAVAAARWEQRDRPDLGVVHATVSVGVTQYAPGDSLDKLLGRAHRALDDATAAGGDRVAAV